MGLRSKLKHMFKKPIVVRPTYSKQSDLLRGRTVLVLGGGTGIGLAISRTLGMAGASIVVASRNPSIDLADEGMAVEIWDVSDIEDISNRFAELAAKYGFDTVVNCQGINPGVDYRQDFFSITPDDFEAVMSVNAESVFFITQAASRYFIDRRIHGHVLNVASTEGLRGGVVPYGISKSAVVSMTNGLGKLLAPYGVIINGIAPGSVATKMTKTDPRGDLTLASPTGRRSIPEEVANVALFMVSDMGGQMCGQIVVVDGGQSLL